VTRHHWAVLMVVAAAVAGLAVIATLPERFIPKRPSDSALFDQWARGSTAAEVAAFDAFLMREGVGDIVPLAELLRSDARWRRCDLPPFAVPPRARWKEIVPTLRYVRDHVEPAVGPVRAVSAYRDPAANRCFGGASASRHMRFAALDLEPVQPLARSVLVKRLCQLHARSGRRLAVGLGIYKGQRFHIDTSGYRRWGSDFRAATSPCLNNS
jgi:hypothetical protein